MEKRTRYFLLLLGGMLLSSLGGMVLISATPIIGGVQKSKVGHEYLRAEELFSNLQADTGVLPDTQPMTIAVTDYPVTQPAVIEGLTYRACRPKANMLQLDVVLEDTVLITLTDDPADRDDVAYNWQHPYYARMHRYIAWQHHAGIGIVLAGVLLLLYSLYRLCG